MVESTKTIGDKGEDIAVEFLENLGFEIIARNWRNRFGEIDIIAKDNDTLVFIEVKAKSSNMFGTPGEMITTKKINKIKNAALIYIKENNYDGPWRIDAVLILDKKLEHIENITDGY